MEQCRATTEKYDHKAARANMTCQEKWEILDMVKKQYSQAATDKPIDCAGEGCERKRVLLYMYRCYFCGRYFCPVCSKGHFGSRFE